MCRRGGHPSFSRSSLTHLSSIRAVEPLAADRATSASTRQLILAAEARAVLASWLADCDYNVCARILGLPTRHRGSSAPSILPWRQRHKDTRLQPRTLLM